jgi:multidrug resistance efflux pump
MMGARLGALEDTAAAYRLGQAEEKIDELENRLDEMTDVMGRMQAELQRRRKGRRSIPVATIGSGSSDDPLEILSESERQQILRQRAKKGGRRKLVMMKDKAVQVPGVCS